MMMFLTSCLLDGLCCGNELVEGFGLVGNYTGDSYYVSAVTEVREKRVNG